MDMPAGDILVFLTGQEEIESLSLLLQDKIKLLPKDANSLLVRFPRSTFHFLFNNNNNNNIGLSTLCSSTSRTTACGIHSSSA